MSVQVSRNFGPLTAIHLVTSDLMREIGEFAVRTIRERTTMGRDYHGAPFARYSPAYALQKGQALLLGGKRARLTRKAYPGARRGGASHLGTRVGWSGPVDLTVSGRMLADMKWQTGAHNRVILSFASMGGGMKGGTFIQRSRSVGAADKAYYHHEAGAGASKVRRQFFDLSDDEMNQIQAKVTAHLDRALQQV